MFFWNRTRPSRPHSLVKPARRAWGLTMGASRSTPMRDHEPHERNAAPRPSYGTAWTAAKDCWFGDDGGQPRGGDAELGEHAGVPLGGPCSHQAGGGRDGEAGRLLSAQEVVEQVGHQQDAVHLSGELGWSHASTPGSAPRPALPRLRATTSDRPIPR